MLPPTSISIAPIWIAVDRPKQAAAALAAVFGGQVKPLASLPGAFTVTAGNSADITFEVCPTGSEWGSTTAGPSGENAFTVSSTALPTPINRQQVEQVAAQEGWAALYCGQVGNWDLVELWIENNLLLELMTPTVAAPVKGFTVEGSTTEGFTVEDFAIRGFAA
ncbi:MAG TPA: hypothetical protein V6D06_04455 [Trichocoleus sp.]